MEPVALRWVIFARLGVGESKIQVSFTTFRMTTLNRQLRAQGNQFSVMGNGGLGGAAEVFVEEAVPAGVAGDGEEHGGVAVAGEVGRAG
jgi:hypothetical protein